MNKAVTLGSAVLLVPVLHLLSISLGPAAGVMLCPVFAEALMPQYSALALSAVDSSSVLSQKVLP